MNHLKSEKVVLSSPMSFSGSSQRAWKLTRVKNYNSEAQFINKLAWIVSKVFLISLALTIILLWWAAIIFWYLFFGILVIPWRLLRRSQRKDKKRELQHRELLEQFKKD